MRGNPVKSGYRKIAVARTGEEEGVCLQFQEHGQKPWKGNFTNPIIKNYLKLWEKNMQPIRFFRREMIFLVILGQDPYHGDGQAHGLCFSVKPDVEIPPSLVNIYKELEDDLGCYIPNNGYLEKWARQGVLMLNTVLTVRAHQANSHRGIGWEEFTDAAIRVLAAQDRPMVFILWGKPAQSKKSMLDPDKHLILEAPHPSPLSAYRGFFGSKPFSKTNAYLTAHGLEPIDWQIENR